MSHSVAFSPEAVTQLDDLEDYISDASSPLVAAHFIDNVISYCESLSLFPLRGTCRDDLLPTLRITHFRHTTVIAFTVDSQTKAVSILGVFYGGKNYAAFIENDGH